MSTKKLLVLTGVFLALFGFVVFFERHQPTSEEREKARKKLLDFRAAEVSSLVVERKDLPKIDLKKGAEGRWTIGGEPAETPAVEGLLADLNRLDLVGETRSQFDPKEYGLDAPRFRVVLGLSGGRTSEVLFGAEIPGTGATAASERGRFGAVRGAPAASLGKPLDDYRSRALLSIPAAEVARVTVARGATRIVAARELPKEGAPPGTPAGEWRLEEPVKDLASGAFVEQLLADLASTRVSEFPPVPPGGLAAVGLQPPLATVTLQPGGRKDAAGRPAALLAFGAARAETTGKVWARRDQALVVVDDRVQEDFAKELSAWREPKVVPVDSFAVTRLSVEAGTLKAAAEKVEGEWRTAGKSVDAAAVTELVDRFSRLEAKAFVPRKDAPRFGIASLKAPPSVRLEILREGRPEPFVARAWSATGDGGAQFLAFETTGRADLVLVDRGAWNDLVVSIEKVRLGPAPKGSGPKPARTPPGALAFPPPAKQAPKG